MPAISSPRAGRRPRLEIVARPVQPEVAKVLDEPDRLIEAVIKFVADSDDALPFIIGMRRVADVPASGIRSPMRSCRCTMARLELCP